MRSSFAKWGRNAAARSTSMNWCRCVEPRPKDFRVSTYGLAKTESLIKSRRPRLTERVTEGRLSQSDFEASSITETRHLQTHQLPHVLSRAGCRTNHLVVVFFEIEIAAEFLLLGCAKIQMLGAADEIGRELGGSESCAFPLRYRFAFLLELSFVIRSIASSSVMFPAWMLWSRMALQIARNRIFNCCIFTSGPP